jgi:hypothetical protein
MPPAEHYHILVTGPSEIAGGQKPLNAATTPDRNLAGVLAYAAMQKAAKSMKSLSARTTRLGDVVLLVGGVPPMILSVAATTRCANLACYAGALRDNGHEVVG